MVYVMETTAHVLIVQAYQMVIAGKVIVDALLQITRVMTVMIV